MTMHESDRRVPVTGLGQSGEGIVETPQGRLFAPGALPGEIVSLDRGHVDGIVESRPELRRAEWLCPHVDHCGGCSLQHMSEDTYRTWKAAALSSTLSAHRLQAEVREMISAPLRSRRRAVLSVRRDPREVQLGFRQRQSHDIVAIEACAIATPRIVEALPGIRALARLLLAAKSETHVTVLETSGGLDIDFETARADLGADERHALSATAAQMKLARLSTGGAPMFLSAVPALDIAGTAVVAPPGAFVQAVAEAERAMQAIAAEATRKSKVVADLFAGIGTFTFALARRSRVLAIDSDKASIAALTDAARKAQGLKPIDAKIRDLFTDPLSPRELDAVDAIVFDPPRAGAKSQAAAIAKSKVKTVVAISCNPTTLARDLGLLVHGGYWIEHVTPIDQFLYTPHLEAVAVLTRPVKR